MLKNSVFNSRQISHLPHVYQLATTLSLVASYNHARGSSQKVSMIFDAKGVAMIRKSEATEAAKILNERRFQQLSEDRRAEIARDAAIAMWAQRRERERRKKESVAATK